MGTKVQSYFARRAEIIADPAASFWLKGCLMSADRRDPADVLADAEALLEIAKLRFDSASLEGAR